MRAIIRTVTTAQPNAYDKEADENMKKGSSQNTLSISETTTPKRTVIKIGGMHCAGCVTAIQGYVLDLPGINKIEVNLANEKATLEYDESKIRLNTIEKAIEEVGYKVVYDYSYSNEENLDSYLNTKFMLLLSIAAV
jgi:copper chaperone CopZ